MNGMRNWILFWSFIFCFIQLSYANSGNSYPCKPGQAKEVLIRSKSELWELANMWNDYIVTLSTTSSRSAEILSVSMGRYKDGQCDWSNRNDPLSFLQQYLHHRTDNLTLHLSPYYDHCIKISTKEETTLYIESQMEFDIWMIVRGVLGTLLFLMAPYIASSTIVHLLVAGIMGSTLMAFILCYFVYKLFFPHNFFFRGIFAFALPFSITTLGALLSYNNVLFIVNNHTWVIYVLMSGGVLCSIWIYLHPLSSRAQDVVRVALRIAGIYLISNSCQSWVGSLLWMITVLIIRQITKIGWTPCFYTDYIEDTFGSVERIPLHAYDQVVQETTRREMQKLRIYMRNNPQQWIHRVDMPNQCSKFCGLDEDIEKYLK